MSAVVDLQGELDGDRVLLAGHRLFLHGHGSDIGFGFGNRRGDTGQRAAHISGQHPDRDVEHAVDFMIPFHVDQLVGIGAVFHQHRTIVGMDDQPLVFFHKTQDGVARNRLAAAGKLDGHAFGAANGHCQRLAARVIFLDPLASQLQEPLGHHNGQLLPKTDIGQHFIAGLDAAFTQVFLPHFVWHDFAHPQCGERLAQQALAQHH